VIATAAAESGLPSETVDFEAYSVEACPSTPSDGFPGVSVRVPFNSDILLMARTPFKEKVD